MSDDNGSSSIGWFLAGLGLGALVGILYAPKPGRETREAILNTAADGREYATTKARETREQVSQWVERGKEAVGKHKESINSALEAGRQAYRDVTEKS